MLNQYFSPRLTSHSQKLCFSRKQKNHSKDNSQSINSRDSFGFDLSIRMVEQQTFTIDISEIIKKDDMNHNQAVQDSNKQSCMDVHVPSINLQNIKRQQMNRSLICSDRSNSMNDSCILDPYKTSKILQNIENKFLVKRSQKQTSNSSNARKFVLTNKNGLFKNSQTESSGLKMDTKQLQSIRSLSNNLYNAFLQVYRSLQNSIQERELLQKQRLQNMQEKKNCETKKQMLKKELQQYERAFEQSKLAVTNLDYQKLRGLQIEKTKTQ